MDFRRGLVSLWLCLSLVATGWAAGPPSGGPRAMRPDCPTMDAASMKADDLPAMPASHEKRGCCHGGACHCIGAHAVAIVVASPAPALQVLLATIVRTVPASYVSPTLVPPVRPPIA